MVWKSQSSRGGIHRLQGCPVWSQHLTGTPDSVLRISISKGSLTFVRLVTHMSKPTSMPLMPTVKVSAGVNVLAGAANNAMTWSVVAVRSAVIDTAAGCAAHSKASTAAV